MSESPQSTSMTSAPTDPGGGRRLLNATALMASGTAISRLLGVVRTMLIAFILGNATLRVDVFNVAMFVPNSLYMLLAGGTLNNVLVPQIVRAVKNDDDGGKAFVDRIITGFLLILGTVTVIFTVATPLVMSVYASSWQTPELAEHWRSLLLMTYLTMPQLFFFGVFFLIGQVLNATEKFGPMMWAPILNNVVSISVFSLYLWIWGTQTTPYLAFTDQQVWLLGVGSTLGIVVQTLALIPYLRRVGFAYRPRFDLKGTGLGRTFQVAKWMVGFVALTSLAQVVVTNLATSAASTGAAIGQAGAGVTAYQNAYLIWILPHSLLTISLATAMLPMASKYAVAGDRVGVRVETERALRLALTFLVPASVAFIVLADPIARLIFGNGTGASDYYFVAWALAGFGIGLVPYTIQYLYLRAFFALDNTKTPFLLQIAISGANAALAIMLVMAWDSPSTVAARLGLAYALSYFLGAFLTHLALKKRLPDLAGATILNHILKLLAPAVVAVALAWVITWLFATNTNAGLRLVGFALAGVVALLAFFFIAKRMGIPEAAALFDILRRRGRDDGEADATEAIVGSQSTDPAGEAIDSGEIALDQTNSDPDGTGVFVAVSISDPLDYPDPANAPVVGLVLADRYELAEQLAVHEGTQTWRATDPVLGRPVLVHLLAEDDARTARVLAAARSAAVTTDSRFLRVLDVVEANDGVNAYLVYEYEAGQTLEKLLRSGPLTSVETAWLVREVADALAPLHAQGHFHQHLNPATVLITANGNLKLLGFEVDAAMHSDGRAAAASTATDVQAMADLLYACLVAHWPHGERFGLPSAPEEAGRALTPSRVRGGVAPALDQVYERIRSQGTPGRASRLFTAQAIAAELSMVLGPANAVSDLRSRLNRPEAEVAESMVGSAASPPVPTPAAHHVFVSGRLPADSPEGDAEDQAFVDSMLARSDNFTPIPPPGSAANRSARNVPLMLLSALVVAAVGIGAAGVQTLNPADPDALAVLAIAKADDFDPKVDGGSGGENSTKVVLAVDGNLQTAWTTDSYRTSKFANKPGVGLLLDLGGVRQINTVKVHLVGRGTDLELRVPVGNSASTKTVESWRVVAATKNAAEAAEFSFTDLRSRYVLVYLTALPAVGDGKFSGGIAEVVLSGS
ncbi:murein biosynthesis integral membrane protein MurJ [Propionicimonas sp.]|uniref:murein biosynthesis integral membrane protein MurJ n=2 Tax=Propionicimonas sp. TaxID=1955623 RepID=UPI001805F555|nr:murein biosynthesis integral membrane protein MurJ [Propionicimonas sp.]MBA3022043.1 murein biosynthesis integral membrane protein MurJ [Propionicimonas sp.]